MLQKKEVYEIKYADTENDRIITLAEVHIIKDGRIQINWKKDYGTPDFSVEEFSDLAHAMKDIAKEKMRDKIESGSDPNLSDD